MPIKVNLAYIDNVFTENTGGGCKVDFVELKDGRIIGISDEFLCVYESYDHFYEASGLENLPTIEFQPKLEEKKDFIVRATYSTMCETTIKARNSKEAYELAKKLDGSAFDHGSLDDWNIESVTEKV